MSIRRNHKDAVKSRAKITRMRDKALKMLARVRATTLAMQERRAARISWWQRAFRVPLVGFYGWVRSRCSTLWAAFMTIIGLKPSVARTAFAARHGEIKQTKQAQTRRLIHETMEARQLLAADVTVVANDTFAQEDPSASPYPNTGQFYIQLDTIHGTDVEVEYALTGTANSENADYVAEVSSSPVPATGTITIKAGATSAVLDIDVIDDDLYDGGDETVILTLTKVSAPLTISKSSDSMSIVDNETAPTISIKATDASAAEPSDTGEFTITQTGKSDADTTVAISYTGTAHPSDYTAASSATITKGTTSATVTVTPTADTLIEGDETVIAKLGAVTANPGIKAVAPTSATVTISDTEDTGSVDVIVNFGPSSISEPSGKTSFDIAILPNKSSTDTVIKYSISGDATEDVDYTLGFSSEREPNNTTAGPQAGVGPQGLAGFSLAKNADIANSTSVPHVSVISTAGTNTAVNDDVYAFYTKTGGAATFDIDGTTGVDTYIELIGTDGTTVLAANNDSASVDSGSASKADSSLTFTLPTAGVYYLRVTDATKAGIPIGASYTAHLSVPGSQGYAVIGGGDISGFARTIFDVTVLDDTIVEASEPVHITLDSIVQGDPQITLSTTKGALDAEVVITDNDSATISIAGTTNGQEPGTNGLFTITQSLKSSVDTIIPWTLDPTSTAKHTKNGTLADPADHSLALSGEVTIKAGATQATIVVPVLDSALIEEDETVVISIGAPTKGDPDVTLGAPSKASILIGDEDTATVDVDAKLAPAHEGAADGKFTFFLSEPPGYPTGTPGQADRDTVITFSIGGTATYGVDYDLVGATVSGGIGTVTIKAFSSTADVTVDATGAFDDLDLEGTEAITLTILTLEAPTDSNIKIGTGSPADSMDLIDNDGLTVKVEGTKDAFEGGALGEFTFSTVGIGTTAVPTVVTYQVKVGSSTAIEGTDFAPLTGKVTIPAGAASQSNTVSIDATGILYDDLLFEGNETVTVEILKVSGGPGLTIDAQSSDDILIIDDEPGTVTIVDIIDAAEATKNGSFTIELGGQSPLPTVIKYEILATKTAATPGSDYKSLGSPYGTVTLNPFVTQAVVPVEVINDTISEGVETVDIKLVSVVSGQPYALGPDGKVNIYSDQLVSVKATDATAGEPSDDGKFTVYLELKDLPGTAASSDVDLVVSYSILTTGSNNATNGVDYATLTGLATIPAGQTSVDIVVDVTDDLTLEATEKVQLRLTGVSGEGDVTLAGTAATDAVRNAVVTISDNDFSYLTVKATKTPGQDNPGSDVDAEFTVYMSQPADQDTVVSYDVSGSATAKTDYTLLSGLVTILKNTTSATITVDVLNDLLIEGTETVTIDLKDPQTLPSKAAHPYDDRIFLGALGTSYIGPGDALLSFQDGGLLGFGPYASGIYTGTQDAYVQQSTVGVNFGVGAVLIDTDNFPGPATAALHGLIKFDDILGTGFGLIPSGSPLLSASLNLNTFDPGPVSFHRMLANWDETTITWASSTLGGNIQPGIQADGVEAVVASSGSGLAFGLSSTPLTSDVQSWVNGTAGLFGWAVLPGGVNATAFKGSEAFLLSDRPMLDVHLDVSATIEIIDTDVATVNVVGSVAGAEPSTKAEIIIGLLDGSNNPVSSSSSVTVNYSDVTPVGAGYAISGSDYAKLSGSVVIPAGATQTSIFIVPNDDSLIEDPETVKINITSVTSADPEITKGSKVDGSTVINDNDFGLVTIKATQSAADENTIGNTKLAPIDGEFTVYISTPSDTDTVVELTITGSATNGADYKTISNFVTIPANQLSAKIPVQVIDDVINESATEDVTLNIVSIKSGHAAIIPASPSSATVFIADDEQVLAASVKATKASASEQIGVSSVDGELQIQLNWASDEDTVIEYSVGGTATDAKVTTLPDYDASQFPGVDATTIDGLGGKTMVGKITIPAGATNAVFPVDVFNDYVAEGPETVVLTITKVTNANGVGVGTASDTVTIEDGKYEVKVEKTDSPASEPGPPGGSNGQFTFTITNPLPEATTITYVVDPSSTASATVDPLSGKADYVALSGTVVLPANQTQVTVDVGVIDDLLVEGDETIVVQLKSASSTGASYNPPAGVPTITVDSTKAVETINDNDSATLTISGVDGAEGGSNGKFIITQSLKSASDTKVTYLVNSKTSSATAADVGMGAFDTTLTATILAGATTATITVPIVDDNIVELTETVVVDLLATKSPTDPQITLGSPASATVKIADNDSATANIIATDPNGFEPGTNDGAFTVFLTNPSSTPTVVTFAIAAGTDATMGDDYLLRDKTSLGPTLLNQITIPANTTSHVIVVDVLDDTLIEDLESVKLQLVSTDNTKIGVGAGVPTVTISPDNDFGLVSIAGTKNAEEAGTVAGQYTVTLDNLSDEDTTVTYSITGGGTADSLDHKLAATGSVVIKAFTTQATISVPVVDDNLAEFTESLEVKLGAITAGHTSNISVDGTKNIASIDILDNDASILTISSPTVSEGAKGAKLEFVVTSPTAVAGGFTVDYKVTDITTGKFGGADYTGASLGTLNFPLGKAGETAVVVLTVTNDNLVELNETVKVTLEKATPGSPLVISGAVGTGTITNDDTATFTVEDVSVVEASSTDPTKAPWTDLVLTVSLDNPIDVDTTVDIDLADLTAVGGDFDPLLALASPNNKVPVSISGFDYDNDAAESKSGFGGGTVSQVTFLAGESTPGNAINPSKISHSYTVRVVQDNIIEGGIGVPTGPADPGSETFEVTLIDATATHKTVTTDKATGKITDDDYGTVSIIANDAKASEPFDTVNEGNGQFTVSLVNKLSPFAPIVSSTDTVITYTVSGTADHKGSDYTPLSGLVTIKAGTTQATIDVNVVDSAELEDDETVVVTLTGFASRDPNIDLLGKLTDTVTIFDDDQAVVTVAATDAAASEDPLDNGQFTLTLSEISDVDTVITYTMLNSLSAGLDGKANNGLDYKLLSGVATIPAGQTQTTIAVEVLQDVFVEGAEDVILKLTGFKSPTNADIKIGGADQATVVIADDIDGIRVNVFNNGNGTESTPATNPGSFIFTITKDDGITPVAAPAGGLTIQYSSLGGTAVPGPTGDYIALPGSVFIPAGQTQLVHDFTVNDDALPEPTETVILTIQNLIHGGFPGGEPASIGVGSATVDIIDNDAVPAKIESIVVNNGDAQRSKVKVVTVTFDTVATVLPGAFTVEMRSDVSPVAPPVGVVTGINVATAVVAGKTVATITFTPSSPFVDSVGSLVDGNFQVTIDPSKVLVVATPLVSIPSDPTGGDLVFGDDAVDGFYRLYGDENGMIGGGVAFVDALDFLSAQNAFLNVLPISAFDELDDGFVDALDFLEVQDRFLNAIGRNLGGF